MLISEPNLHELTNKVQNFTTFMISQLVLHERNGEFQSFRFKHITTSTTNKLSLSTSSHFTSTILLRLLFGIIFACNFYLLFFTPKMPLALPINITRNISE